MASLPEVLSIEQVAQTDLFQIEALELKFSNGARRCYERLKSQNMHAVMIVPVLNGEELLLVREYGAGLNAYYLSFPKGAIEPGETLLEAAERELREEVGYGSRQIVPMMTVTNAPSYSTAHMALVCATDLYPASAQGDEPEPLEIVRWPLSELDALLVHPEFHEAKALLALLWLKQSQMIA